MQILSKEIEWLFEKLSSTKKNIMGIGVIVIYAVLGLVVLVAKIILLNFGATWLRAYFSGAKVTFMELIALQLRQIPVRRIVDVRITLIKTGFNVSVDDLSTHYLAGGDVEMVAEGMIKAKEKNIDLSFDQACALDLQDKGLLEEED